MAYMGTAYLPTRELVCAKEVVTLSVNAHLRHNATHRLANKTKQPRFTSASCMRNDTEKNREYA